MTTRENNAERTRENLGSLDDEIRQGILNLSAAGNFDKAVIESEIQAIIVKSALGNSDPSVGLLLFRKYADIANEIAYEKRTQTKISFNRIQFDPSALILQDINQDRLVGFNALGENVFWLRVVTSVFAFISMVVMVSIPKIGDSNFCPSFGHFNCYVFTMYGNSDCFHQKPYWFLIAASAAIVALNLFLVCYFLLSTNDNGKKFIPGVCVLAECPSFVNPLVDFILLACSFAAAIASSVALQKVVYFYSGSISGYYTIASIYQQFSHTSPPCLSDSDDPSPRLFASIMMMFITSCFMCLCFVASFNHYRKQRIADAGAPGNDKGVKVLEQSSADEV